MSLPTNFVDDVLDSSMSGRRRYLPIANQDGTTSFEDQTIYTQTGSSFGAAQINATNAAVNNLMYYIGPFDLTAGIQTYVFTDSNFHADRDTCDVEIIVDDSDGSLEAWSDAEPSFVFAEGSFTVNFAQATASAIHICHVGIKNITLQGA